MKRLLAAAFLAACSLAQANRILLAPLDSRPAAGQFAQMIARMAGEGVNMPAYEDLGQFTRPGNPDSILEWLESQDYDDVDAVVASADMIAYGGLIQSRVNDIPLGLANARLNRLAAIARAHPNVKFYVFSAVMRLAPTATRQASAWRIQLARFEEIQDRYNRAKDPKDYDRLKNLRAKIPSGEIERYERTRQRNHAVQVSLLKLTAKGVFSYLVIGQDDARVYGPHVPETSHLKQVVATLGIGGKVYFCEGIDQHANVLVSRALLNKAGWTPRVRVVYSDDEGRLKYNPFESKPIEESLRDQLLASGARPATSDTAYDYTLYLNTPGRRPGPFADFVTKLKAELDEGFPVCVADINLAKDGAADQELFDDLFEQQRMMRLLSFAGWNTAGNTMGTAIPAANVYLLARKLRVDPLERELAQRTFLLHRFVNDFAFHRYTRPAAYRLLTQLSGASREETVGPSFRKLNSFVQSDLGKRLDSYFKNQFLDRRFFAGNQEYRVSNISDVKIFLPWPRAYEVRIEFALQAEPASAETAPGSVQN